MTEASISNIKPPWVRIALWAYMVDNQVIGIPETIDTIRALTEAEPDAQVSIRRTNEALGITRRLLPELQVAA